MEVGGGQHLPQDHTENKDDCLTALTYLSVDTPAACRALYADVFQLSDRLEACGASVSLHSRNDTMTARADGGR